MKPNYYISGASGFIGRNLCRMLEGDNVFDLKVSPIIPYQDFIVIHLAAYGNHHFQDSISELIETNINYLRRLIRESNHGHLIKFINVSTSSVTLPVQTPYSASKLLGETIINSLGDKRFVNVRPYSVYGPGEADHRFIPTVIRHLHSGEKMELDTMATHDWIYVDDFIKAMLSGYTNIGTGIKHTNYDVVRMLESISGKDLNYEDKNMREYDNDNWVSPTRVPHRVLYEGLKQTYESITAKGI